MGKHEFLKLAIVGSFLAFLISAVAALPQNPQTQTAPIYAVNAKYTNGVAPGYWPTQQAVGSQPAASGLNINVGPGTANCGAGLFVEYAGGTKALTANTTNYLYIDTTSSCAVSVKTSAFVGTDFAIAKVITGSSTITSIDDVRTFVGSSGGSGIVSGQAANVIPLGGGATLINAQSHLNEITAGVTTDTQEFADNSTVYSTPAGIDTNTGTAGTSWVLARFLYCPNLSTGKDCDLDIGNSTSPGEGTNAQVRFTNMGSSSTNYGSLGMSDVGALHPADALRWYLDGTVRLPNLISIPCLGTDGSGFIGSGSCGSSGTGVMGGITNATDPAWGVSTSNTAAQNQTAFATIAAAVNAGTTPAHVYLPPGTYNVLSTGGTALGSYTVINKTLVFDCADRTTTIINQTGTGSLISMGQAGTFGSSTLNWAPTIFEHCQVTGGGSASDGVFIPTLGASQAFVVDNYFFNYGNNSMNCQVHAADNNQLTLSGNVFWRYDHATSVCHAWAQGNSTYNLLTAKDNSVICSQSSVNGNTQICGIGFRSDGYMEASGNTMSGPNPLFNCGSGGTSGVANCGISNNPILEQFGTYGITFGTPGGSSAETTNNLQVNNNTVYMPSGTTSFIGPANSSSLIANADISLNHRRADSLGGSLLVTLNNTSGQTGNQALGTTGFATIQTTGSNIATWSTGAGASFPGTNGIVVNTSPTASRTGNATDVSSVGYVVDTGAADVYVATLVPAITSYTSGLSVRIKVANTNTTTTPTLNVNGLGPITITKNGAGALVAGDVAAGQIKTFQYDGTNFQLSNPATAVNNVAGTSPIVVTPSGGNYTVSCPTCSISAGGTSVNNNGASTLGTSQQDGMLPYICKDTSGSGTAQTCNSATSFTVTNGNCFVYKTTTTNSGAGLTVNPNSLGVTSIAIPGASGWTTTLTAGVIPANEPLALCYDGTNLNVQQTGKASSNNFSNWINSTPTPTCNVGTATTVVSSVNYETVGQTTFVNFTVTLTTAGSCNGGFVLTMPFTAATDTQLNCREDVNFGTQGTASMIASGNVATIRRYDNSTGIWNSNGTRVGCQGVVQTP